VSLETDIQAALYTHFTTPALESPVKPRAAPFVAYTPVPGTAYYHVHPVLRAEPQRPGIGFTGSVLRRGIFQIDAVAPDGAGEAPGLRMAGLVAARFAIGTKLVAGAGSARRRLLLDKEPTIASAVKDAPWVRFPVSIPFLVIT